MVLKIKFERKRSRPDRSLIEHLVLSDGCEGSVGNGHKRYLFDQCKYIAEHCLSVYGKIDLSCSKCKKDYTVTKKQYEKAYVRYLLENSG